MFVAKGLSGLPSEAIFIYLLLDEAPHLKYVSHIFFCVRQELSMTLTKCCDWLKRSIKRHRRKIYCIIRYFSWKKLHITTCQIPECKYLMGLCAMPIYSKAFRTTFSTNHFKQSFSVWFISLSHQCGGILESSSLQFWFSPFRFLCIHSYTVLLRFCHSLSTGLRIGLWLVLLQQLYSFIF